MPARHGAVYEWQTGLATQCFDWAEETGHWDPVYGFVVTHKPHQLCVDLMDQQNSGGRPTGSPDLGEPIGPNVAPAGPQNVTSIMSADEQEAENEKDEAICRSLPTVEQRVMCWASAEERRAARVRGRPLPPLITRRESIVAPKESVNPWVIGGVFAGGGAAVLCALAEPCGAVALGAIGIGGVGLIGAQ